MSTTKSQKLSKSRRRLSRWGTTDMTEQEDTCSSEIQLSVFPIISSPLSQMGKSSALVAKLDLNTAFRGWRGEKNQPCPAGIRKRLHAETAKRQDAPDLSPQTARESKTGKTPAWQGRCPPPPPPQLSLGWYTIKGRPGLHVPSNKQNSFIRQYIDRSHVDRRLPVYANYYQILANSEACLISR